MKSLVKRILCTILTLCIVSSTALFPAFATETSVSNSSSRVTLNSVDQLKLKSAIDALQNPITEGIALAKDIYSAAFSYTFTMSDTPAKVLEQIFVTGDTDAAIGTASTSVLAADVRDMLVPSLYSEVPTVSGMTEAAKALAESDLVIGDLLLYGTTSSAEIYIYNGEHLVKLVKDNLVREAVDDVIIKAKAAEKFVVLRPSLGYDFYRSADSENYDEFSSDATVAEMQKAIAATAKAYLLRGYRVQYGDSNLDGVNSTTSGEFRWQIYEKAPEDCTHDSIGYTNCAVFCFEVLKNAIGFELSETELKDSRYFNSGRLMWATKYIVDFTNADDGRNIYKNNYYEPVAGGATTEEEIAQVKADFFNTLQPGDIINVRYVGDSNGHAMLYVGNGTIIHSSGYKYNYTSGVEETEASIRVMGVEELFIPGARRYLFDKLSKMTIVRPIGKVSGLAVTDAARKRMNEMNGIVAEKLSSVNEYVTVNPGDEITYTFSIFNTNEVAKTIDVKDVVPANTTFKSISEGGIQNGTSLSWSVSVPANTEVQVSYTVTVNADTYGKTVVSDSATVGGLLHKCPTVNIEKTLTAAEQAKVVSAIDELGSTNKGVAYLNAIYKEAIGVDEVVPAENATAILSSAYEYDDVSAKYGFREDSLYTKMAVPKLFGGKSVKMERFSNDRTRLVKLDHLMIGDVVLAMKGATQYFYIKTDDGLINLQTGGDVANPEAFLESLLITDRFFVIRPSLVDEYVDVAPPDEEIEEVVETPAKEMPVFANDKVWFALNGNSKLYMEYQSDEYINRITLTDYLPGLDYAGIVQAPRGVFATDYANVLTGANNYDELAVFPYSLDKTPPATATNETEPYFKTGTDGNVYWTIDGTDYLVKPDRKAIKLVAAMGLAYLNTNPELKAKYETLDGMTIDIPDGKYKDVTFLAGMMSESWGRQLIVTFVYSDGTESDPIYTKVVGQAKSGNNYTTGSLYFDRMNGAVGTQVRDWHTFKPYKIEVPEADAAKTLTSIKLKPGASSVTGTPSQANMYPHYIISAWGTPATTSDYTSLAVAEVEGEMKAITTASTYADAKAVYDLYTSAIKIAGVEAALNTSVVSAFNKTFEEIKNNTKLTGTIVLSTDSETKLPKASVTIKDATACGGKAYKVILGFFGSTDELLGVKEYDRVSTQVASNSEEIKLTAGDILDGTTEIKGFIWDFAKLSPLVKQAKLNYTKN